MGKHKCKWCGESINDPGTSRFMAVDGYWAEWYSQKFVCGAKCGLEMVTSLLPMSIRHTGDSMTAMSIFEVSVMKDHTLLASWNNMGAMKIAKEGNDYKLIFDEYIRQRFEQKRVNE